MVNDAVAKVGAQGPKDMGAVMKALLPEVQGKAEGKAISDLVKERLSQLCVDVDLRDAAAKRRRDDVVGKPGCAVEHQRHRAEVADLGKSG